MRSRFSHTLDEHACAHSWRQRHSNHPRELAEDCVCTQSTKRICVCVVEVFMKLLLKCTMCTGARLWRRPTTDDDDQFDSCWISIGSPSAPSAIIVSIYARITVVHSYKYATHSKASHVALSSERRRRRRVTRTTLILHCLSV